MRGGGERESRGGKRRGEEGGMSLQASGTVKGVSEKMQKRRQRGREREREKKNLIQIIFTPWALKCKSQIKEVWNGKLARLEENIIKLGLYMYVQDVRETRWTQVMELTCT